MIGLGIAVLLLHAVTATIEQDFNSFDRHCEGELNGYKYQNPMNCTEFYTCINEGSWLESCATGLSFDTSRQECDLPENVACQGKHIPICTNRNAGMILEHDDCSKFLICDENTWQTMQCEDGMSFDRELKTCHWLKKEKCAEAIHKRNIEFANQNAKPTELTHRDSRCPRMETEAAVHLTHPTSCSKFFKCFLGVAYLEECPSGLHFSTQLDRCEDIEIAGCKLRNGNKYFLQESTGVVQQLKPDFSYKQPEETYVESSAPVQHFKPQPDIVAEYEKAYQKGLQELSVEQPTKSNKEIQQPEKGDFSNKQSEKTNVEFNVPVIQEQPEPIEVIHSIVDQKPQPLPTPETPKQQNPETHVNQAHLSPPVVQQPINQKPAPVPQQHFKPPSQFQHQKPVQQQTFRPQNQITQHQKQPNNPNNQKFVDNMYNYFYPSSGQNQHTNNQKPKHPQYQQKQQQKQHKPQQKYQNELKQQYLYELEQQRKQQMKKQKHHNHRDILVYGASEASEQPSAYPIGIPDGRCPWDVHPTMPIHLSHLSDCSKFYKCFLGSVYEQDCPDGLEWSVKMDRCEHSNIAECSLFGSENPRMVVPEINYPVMIDWPESSWIERPTIRIEPAFRQDELDEYIDGVADARCDETVYNVVHLEHPTECNKFYKCFHGRAHLINCPPGLHWANKLNRCDFKHVAKCPHRYQY